MAGDVGVSALLPGETRCRHVHDGFLELLVLYRVVDGHVAKPEIRDGQIEGLVVGPTRVPAQVEGFYGRYHPGRGVRCLRLSRARTLFVPVLVLRRGLLEVLLVEHVFGENGLGARLGTRLPCRLCGLVSARIATRLRVGPRHGHVEGRTVRHRRAVRVVDLPPLAPAIVPDADGVVVVGAATAPGVPGLGDREDRPRFAVDQGIVQVGAVIVGVLRLGAVDEFLRPSRDDHLKGRSGRYRRPVLVEDGPTPGSSLVPDADVVVVDTLAIATLLWYRAYEDDGVRVPVDARLGEVGVIAAAVVLVAAVDEGGVHRLPGSRRRGVVVFGRTRGLRFPDAGRLFPPAGRPFRLRVTRGEAAGG